MGGRTPELGERGQQLWADLHGDELGPAPRLLAEEICRCADRLDRLDRLLRGDDDLWIRLRSRDGAGGVVEVSVGNVLAEARQQQVALKQMLGEFRHTGAIDTGALPAPTTPQATGGSFRDDLRARRAARLADAAGS